MRKTKFIRNAFMAIAVLIITGVCIPQHLYGDANNSEPGITGSDAAIVTTGDINLQGFFEILKGDVCSRQGNIDLGKKKKVNITPSGDPNWIISVADGGKTLTCNRATLTDVRGNSVPTSLCQIGNTDPTGLPCPSDPTVMFPSPFPVGLDTVCKSGQPLTPGNYGNVNVPRGEVCIFDGPGVYNLTSLHAKKGSEVVFQTPNPTCDPLERFDIFIEDFARFEEGVTVNRSKEAAAYINVDGEDGDGGNKNRCPKGLDPGNKAAAFCVDGDGHEFNVCWAYVPRGTVSLGGYVDIEAQIFSKHVNQRRQLNVTLTLPNPDCCVPPPPEPPDCACYIDFTAASANPTPGTLVLMTGHNFINDPSIPKRTVDRVAFVPAGVSIPSDDPLAADVDACLVTNPNITSSTTLEFNIPATCPAGTYNLVLLNLLEPTDKGPWCSNSSLTLTVN